MSLMKHCELFNVVDKLTPSTKFYFRSYL